MKMFCLAVKGNGLGYENIIPLFLAFLPIVIGIGIIGFIVLCIKEFVIKKLRKKNEDFFLWREETGRAGFKVEEEEGK